MKFEIESESGSHIADAMRLMTEALVILDANGSTLAAISLSMAITQMGGVAPLPMPVERMFSHYG